MRYVRSCSFIATIIVNIQLQMESTRADRLQNELEHMTAQNREMERMNAQLSISNQVNTACRLNDFAYRPEWWHLKIMLSQICS